jgi:hypothetical protein
MATVQYFRDKLAGSILELWWHHKNLSFPIYFNINNDIMLKNKILLEILKCCK